MLGRLSRRWGRPLEEIYVSMDELAFQAAFDRVEPPPEIVHEYMVAQLTSYYISAHTGKGKRAPAPSDLMVSVNLEKRQQRRQSSKEQRRMIEVMFGAPKHLRMKSNGE